MTRKKLGPDESGQPLGDAEAAVFRALILVYRRARKAVVCACGRVPCRSQTDLEEAVAMATRVCAHFGLGQDDGENPLRNLTGWPPEPPKAGGEA
jgi:hypothetical protein